MKRRLTLILCLLMLAFGEEKKPAPEFITIPAAKTGELTPSNGLPKKEQFISWTRSHGDAGSRRYSHLSRIHRGNVGDLRVAWEYRSGDGKGNIQANPVIANGRLFAPTVGGSVVALDAATGKELWRTRLGRQPAHRGLVYWPGDAAHPARLYLHAESHLYALDAQTGQPVIGFGTNGRVAANGVVAPVIVGDLVVSGLWNVVKGFDVVTGKEAWDFPILPETGKFGSEQWQQPHIGGNIWGGIAADIDRGIVYVSTGSPHPNFIGVTHPGDNLFANCVVALRAANGKRIWHFQEIRHDIWDLDIPAPPVLVTVKRDGRMVDAVAQVTKIGNTLLLDRVTGIPLFPFRMRKAAESNLPGERTAAYQPDLELPQPFARQAFTEADITERTPEARAFVRKKLENATMGWFQPFVEGRPNVFFGIHGGAEWTGAAFDPGAGTLFVSSNEVPWIITVSKAKATASVGENTFAQFCSACHGKSRQGASGPALSLQMTAHIGATELAKTIRNGKGAMPPFRLPAAQLDAVVQYLLGQENAPTKPDAANPYTSNGYHKLLDDEGYPGSKPPWGTLNAIDLNTGRIRWRVPLGEYDELTRQGMPVTGTENFGGAIVTAGGLVFCGGTRDKKIRAFDKDPGRERWSYRLPFGGYAPPATYEVGGRQYVVIPASGGGKLADEQGDAYVAFALPR